MKRRTYRQVKNRNADLVARTVEANERARQQQSGCTDVDDDIPEVKKKMTNLKMIQTSLNQNLRLESKEDQVVRDQVNLINFFVF